MEIVNAARHTVADYTIALDVAGREYMVLAIKATYKIPSNDRRPRPLIPAQPLNFTDLFAGEPGLSAPLAEVDFALRKAKCDVVFNGSAHVPNGVPVEQLEVEVSVATMYKRLLVMGDRHWRAGVTGWSASEIELFTRMPLHYGRAFGGFHTWQRDDKDYVEAYADNSVGTGYAKKVDNSVIEGMALPNLFVSEPLRITPTSHITPVALSVLPRNHPERRQYAGTYDDIWRQNDFPYLPRDFDERYFQTVPADQQIDYPRGGEEVVLINMLADRPEVRFKLPRFDNLPIQILMADYRILKPELVVDTLYFEPDAERFSAVWRTAIPIKRKLQEIDTIAIGPVCQEWWGKKTLGLDGCSRCRDKQKEPLDEAV